MVFPRLSSHSPRPSGMSQQRNTQSPGLVGETFLLLGKSAWAVGDQTMAQQCFTSVRNDMKENCHPSLPKHCRFEKAAIWYWYQQACHALLDGLLAPETDAAKEIHAEMQQMQRTVGELEAFTPPTLPCGLRKFQRACGTGLIASSFGICCMDSVVNTVKIMLGKFSKNGVITTRRALQRYISRLAA